MKKGAVVFFLVLAGLAGLVGTLGAQAQEPKGQMFIVYQCVVKPSMEARFREASKADAVYYSKMGVPYPWTAYSADDGCYYFLYPVKDSADIGNLFKAYEEVDARDPAGSKALSAKFAGTYESQKAAIYTFVPGLSLISKNPYHPASETNFLFLDIWYIEPGRQSEAEALWKEIMELARSKGVRDTWYGLVGGVGTDQPVYISAGPDKGEREFLEHNAEMWRLMGDAANAPYSKALSLCRKREAKRLWYEADLSYTPVKK